jgi:hypothetical protein
MLPLKTTLQSPVPVQTPLHPVKTEFVFGTAEREIEVPSLALVEQVPPQFMTLPPETVPPPAPALRTVRLCNGTALKVAVTDMFPLAVMIHIPVPEQLPLHPPNEELLFGVAVKVIESPSVIDDEQVPPQFMEPPETVPAPTPDLKTEILKVEGVGGGGGGVGGGGAEPVVA